MAGSELLNLLGELDVVRSDCTAYLVPAVTNHHDESRWLELACGIDDVLQKRAPGRRMKDLGQRGTHALARACRENHDVHAMAPHSTVTDFARLRGLSTSVPRAHAVW